MLSIHLDIIPSSVQILSVIWRVWYEGHGVFRIGWGSYMALRLSFGPSFTLTWLRCSV